MKSKVINLFCAACVACAFTACNSDDDRAEVIDGGIDPGVAVEDAVVKLTVSQNLGRTYASTSDKAAEGYEIDPGNALHLYIFNDLQVFEKYEPLSLQLVSGYTDVWETPEFTIASGNKYFYAFANVPSTISTPANGSNRVDFEKQIINLTGGIDAITQKNNFFMGTLYGGITPVQGTGITGTPETITLTIGRLSAKVTIDDEETPTTNSIAGKFDFDNGAYRILNEATQYYTVGQWSSGFRTLGSQVTTPQYSLIDANLSNLGSYIQSFPTNVFTPIGTPVYTSENTNAEPRRGTNTAVQIRYKYTPAASELYDVTSNQNNATPAGDGSFWIAVMDDLRKVMYNGDPSGVTGVQSYEKYTGGYCYYIVYLADDSETASPSLKYSVIRNHYYELAVKSVSSLGNSDPDDIPDPKEPIDKEDNVIKVLVKVYDWFEIKQEVNL